MVYDDMTANDDAQERPLQGKRTVTDLVFPTDSQRLRRRLEDFRQEYELLHGPTDITLRYTSMLSETDQQDLF
ncbi:MAG TPA: hypothetical protein VGL72_20405, partial [Bryobacteraceae bacterium]